MAEIETETKRNLDDMIFIIRNQRVMIDRDLAKLYGVPTYRLNEAVKRHINRFPLDFMFRITKQELDELIAICDEFASLKHSSSYPFAFTEHGVAMLASVLNTDKAIEINIEIIRAFVRLRKYVNALNEGNNIDDEQVFSYRWNTTHRVTVFCCLRAQNYEKYPLYGTKSAS